MASIRYTGHDILLRKFFIVANQPHPVKPATADTHNFNTTIAAPLKEFKVYFGPKQSGRGDPSPDNVRWISGRKELSIYHSAENLYVPNPNNKGYINKSGSIYVDTTSTYTDPLPVNAGDTYSFRCTTVSVKGETNRRIHGYNSSGNWVQQITYAATPEYTVEDRKIIIPIPDGISYIRASFRNQDTNVRIAKENVLDVEWPYTVFGGYLDMVNGEMWSAYERLVFDGSSDEEWSLSGEHGFCYNVNLFSEPIPKVEMCDRYKAVPNSSIAQMSDYQCAMDPTGTQLQIVDQSVSTIEEWKTKLSDGAVTVLIQRPELRKSLQLDPIVFKTFRGANNIFSSLDGDIDLQYYTN